MNKKSLVIGIGAVIGVILLIVVIVAVAKGNNKAKENTNVNEVVENETVNETTNNTTEEETPEEITYERVDVTLTEKLENKRIDNNLRIEFVGQKETYGEDMYTYNADVYVNDQIVDIKIFNFVSARVIYSSNQQAEFYVDRVDDVYIIVSHLLNNTDGYYVVFVNTDGEVLNEFNNVTLTRKDHTIMISLDAPLEEDERIYTNFKIEGNKIGVKFDKVSKN